MNFLSPIPILDIATNVFTTYIGDTTLLAYGINEIHKVRKGDITFVDHPKYYAKCLESQATIILINKKVECPPGKLLLVVENPFDVYNSLMQKYTVFIPATQAISATAVVGATSIIQPNVFIGENVRIGENCCIHANVSIYTNTIIGDNVIIHANTVIGADAFYYKKIEGKYIKWISGGRVIIEDDVEIGASCTIDKGVSADTIIGKGSKLDNQIHIGHDTIIGKNCLFAAQVAIAGVTTIEDDVVLWGQVGVNKDLTIGKGAVVYAQSGVAKSIEGGKTYFGSPVIDAKQKMREIVLLKNLDELFKK